MRMNPARRILVSASDEQVERALGLVATSPGYLDARGRRRSPTAASVLRQALELGLRCMEQSR